MSMQPQVRALHALTLQSRVPYHVIARTSAVHWLDKSSKYTVSCCQQLSLVAAALASTVSGARWRRLRGQRTGRTESLLSARAGWHSWNCGIGVEISDDGTLAKRIDYNTKPQGHCFAVSAAPMHRSFGADGGQAHYAELEIETNNDDWNYGLEIGVTTLTPAELGKANPESLSWAELQETWVIDSDGKLRLRGRAVPPGSFPGRRISGYNAQTFAWRDRVGILAQRRAIMFFVNGELLGSIEVGDIAEVPVDRDLYLVVDVVGKACEIALLDSKSPG